MVDDAAALVAAQGLERQAQRVGGALSPGRAVVKQIVTSRADHEERHIGRGGDHLLDELEEGRLRPMNILDADDQRSLAGDRLQQVSRGPGGVFDPEGGGGQTDDGGDPLDDLRLVRKDRKQLCVSALRRVLVEDGGELTNDLAQWPERDSLAVREAPAAQHACLRPDA